MITTILVAIALILTAAGVIYLFKSSKKNDGAHPHITIVAEPVIEKTEEIVWETKEDAKSTENEIVHSLKDIFEKNVAAKEVIEPAKPKAKKVSKPNANK